MLPLMLLGLALTAVELNETALHAPDNEAIRNDSTTQCRPGTSKCSFLQADRERTVEPSILV